MVDDRDGAPLKIGDRVRVLELENLSDMAEPARTEVSPVFAHIVGKYWRVAGFDEHGNVEIAFEIRKGPLKGLHSVWVSPKILRKKDKRKFISEDP